MATPTSKALQDYLALRYPFDVVADPDGDYVIRFPDLPGCMTQVESLDDVSAMAEEARTLWIETEYELGHDIPLPSYPAQHSGKFNVRLSRSLHRSLAEAAERNGVSLNHYVSDILARGDAQARIERRLEDLAQHVDALGQALRHSFVEAPELGSGLALRDDETKHRTKVRY